MVLEVTSVLPKFVSALGDPPTINIKPQEKMKEFKNQTNWIIYIGIKISH